MGTPCSAPFLGTAAAFAMAEGTPAWKTLTMFTLVGAGLAFPFTLLSFVPALTRRLPRPGAWMETVKVVMGFSLMGTAVWLYRVLATAFSFLTFEKAHRQELANCAVPAAASAENDHIHWIPFTPDRVQKELASGKTVFLDFTAEWCTSCKANEKFILETTAVRAAFQKTGVVPIRVDMTDSDDTNDAWRARLGRGRDIPAYALLKGSTINLLPVVITVESVVTALEHAVQ
jgi:thiol:disulfide interchange protein